MSVFHALRRPTFAVRLESARPARYPCEVCGSLAELLREADASVTRGLPPAERREFLDE